MSFIEAVRRARGLLETEQRISLRALKRELDLDDETLGELTQELVEIQRVAVVDGKALVWVGDRPRTDAATTEAESAAKEPSPLEFTIDDAERRQLTVLFCDLVSSTALSERLDPEDLRQVVRAYQESCARVIRRFEGHLAKYLGDGLLVHFGYPVAHEDDAERAVRAGLGIVEEIQRLGARIEQEHGVELAVRIGIHTGLVVAGEMGVAEQRESLAVVGETPNVAARLQELAEPNTVVIGTPTLRLVQGLFTCRELGSHVLKGLSAPIAAYRVLHESGVRGRLEAAAATGLTPLVGRAQEVGVLLDRWEQARDGQGQVVMLGGEAGVGKSRLVQALRERLADEPHTWLECRCSPYTQNSALHPVIELVQQALRFGTHDSAEHKLRLLEQALEPAGFSLPEVIPLFTDLLSVPLPERHQPSHLSPERQRQKTLETLLAWLFAMTEQQPVLLVVEDLHWVDPSTLELLGLLIDREPTVPLLSVFTSRPGFRPPWGAQAHVAQLTLNRLARPQVAVMAERVAGGKKLPDEALQEIVAKTDGVPLFVEELTKMVLESGLLREAGGRYELAGPLPALAVPDTLHDSLMARLDRLGAAKEVAQLGATLGRGFGYELLRLISPLEEARLRQALQRLVDAELIYERGTPPEATYIFKHALVQETAYQSLLRSKRRQYHHRIAETLVERFAEIAETEPELLAHHYSEAGLGEEAVVYWQRAGDRAAARSAHAEAIAHLTRGVEQLSTLAEGAQRNQRELIFQVALGASLVAAKGYAWPEVERVYGRALELGGSIGEAPELSQALAGLGTYYMNRVELKTTCELGNQLLTAAGRTHEAPSRLWGHTLLAMALYYSGEPRRSLQHAQQAIDLYDPSLHRHLVLGYGQDVEILSRAYAGWSLWQLGYSDRALQQCRKAIELARQIAHPFSLVHAFFSLGILHCMRREYEQMRDLAEETISIATEQSFLMFLGLGILARARAIAALGTRDGVIEEFEQGMTQAAATGTELGGPQILGELAEIYRTSDRRDEAMRIVEAGLALSEAGPQPYWQAELHRQKGELFLAASAPTEEESEQLFHRAVETARSQEAKSLELRAATSLARLWQRQGKRDDARALLAPIYGWFTEGFDTQDLQDAKALLEELG